MWSRDQASVTQSCSMRPEAPNLIHKDVTMRDIAGRQAEQSFLHAAPCWSCGICTWQPAKLEFILETLPAVFQTSLSPSTACPSCCLPLSEGNCPQLPLQKHSSSEPTLNFSFILDLFLSFTHGRVLPYLQPEHPHLKRAWLGQEHSN